MAFAISIEADGSSPVMEALTKLAGLDTTAMFDEIGAELVSSTQRRFTGQHDVDGNPWKQSWRAKNQGREKNQGGQTLRDTGRLMNSITHNVLANGVEVGTDFEYAHVLHFGADIYPKTAQFLTFAVGGEFRRAKHVKIPPREFLGLDTEDEQNILNIIGRHIGV